MSEIYHRQFGSGEPIILIHGLFGSLENLGMITRLLKDHYTVYSLDLPNHGRSEHTKETSLAEMAESVRGWMDSANIEKAHFLGHSLGGKVSMELALRYPEKIGKLIVADIAPVQYQRRHDDVLAGLNAIDLSALATRADADTIIKPYVPEVAVRTFLLKNLEKSEDGWRWRVNLPVLEAHYNEFIAGNSTDLSPFAGPTLFIKGEKSPYILPEHREHTLSLFPNADVKIINDTEHWLHAEKPDIFTGIVKRFLVK